MLLSFFESHSHFLWDPLPLSFSQGDYHNPPLKDNSFDGVYDFEAICHSKSLEKVYSEAFRVLKPGGLFVLEDWFMTDKYKPSNPEHQRIKSKIEVCRVCTQTDTHTHAQTHHTHHTHRRTRYRHTHTNTDAHIHNHLHVNSCLLVYCKFLARK